MTCVLIDDPSRARNRLSHGFFEDFIMGRTAKERIQYPLADLAAGADLAATIIAALASPVLITGVTITPDGSAAGVDGSNTSVWALTDGTNTIVTKTYDNVTVFPADNVQESLGAIAFGAIAAGGRLELAVTNGATANLPAVTVEIEYIPLTGALAGWNILASDEGVFTISDEAGGIIVLTPSDATAADNDEIYLYRSIEQFLIAAGKPLEAHGRLRFSEANTDDANVLFGVMSGVAANALQDDGAGPAASFSGAVLFKTDGSTAWKFMTSVGAAQKVSTTDVVAASAAFVELSIEIRPKSATEAEAIPFINGQQCRDANGIYIKHLITYTGATEMTQVVGVKNGGANAESLRVDYLSCRQAR